MKTRLLALALTAALTITIAQAQDAGKVEIIVERNVMVPMRDGVKLATFIHRPKTDRKVPVILTRTPYGAERRGPQAAPKPVPADSQPARYATVVQDTRGRFASEGEFYPMKDDPKDGYDTIEWLAQQPWCDGNVGMVGGSYGGYVQVVAAVERPPHLKALWAQVPVSDMNDSLFFQGGALRQELGPAWTTRMSFTSQRVLRKEVPQEEVDRWSKEGDFKVWSLHLPLADVGAIVLGGPSYVRAWNDYIGAWEKPHYWDAISAVENAEKFTVPIMIVAGWYDIYTEPNLKLWAELRERGGSEITRRETRLIMGPWLHGCRGPAGSVSFPNGDMDFREMQSQWLDRWLCGKTNASVNWSPLRYYVMQSDRWVEDSQWPPKQSKPTKYYLSCDAAAGQRTLSTQPPTTASPPSAYTYDPAQPVNTLGGNNLGAARGIQDHWGNAKRQDVLGFESAPLEKDLTLIGPVRAHLVVASSAPDTDFTAMLIDVQPAKAGADHPFHANVRDGLVRARYRHGRDRAELLEPGKPVELDIDLWSTAYTFKAGHRLRLNVSSSNFPRFDRNLNTADPPAHGTTMQKAENKVFHDPARPSYVELPVSP
jgi:putative CocE/NonD family hydrolase